MPKNTHDRLKKAALSRTGVKKEYDALNQEFSLLDTMLKARLKAGKTQNDVARVMRTTTSVVGRLETGGGKQKHSPTIDSLRRYAKAVNCDLEVKFVHSRNKPKNITKRDHKKNRVLECK